MSAILSGKADIGHKQTRTFQMGWNLDRTEGAYEIRITYQVNYPSVWHRGRGSEPDVVVHAIERCIDDEWRPAQLDKAQRQALLDELIESEELYAPYCDG